MTTALLIGSTGLVGRHCLDALVAETRYERVVAFTRRPLWRDDPRLVETIVDFDSLAELTPFPEVTDVFCAIGTTIGRAGSQHEFLKIDFEYPRIVAERSAAAGARQFLLVSSVGADAKSSNFYLRVKAEVEKAVCARAFESVSIFRPSFLIGSREEFRLSETLGIAATRAIQFALSGRLRKYRAIRAATVAAAMVNAAHVAQPGHHIYHYDEILALAGQTDRAA